MKRRAPRPRPEEAPTVHTLGTSNRTPEEFLALLEHFGIKRVLDVRRFPRSRFEHFCAGELARHLRREGFEYFYLGEELGGYRKEGYEAYLGSRGFNEGIRRAERLAAGSPSAILCAERLPWRCHRRFIGRALEERGWRVAHIIEKERLWVPE